MFLLYLYLACVIFAVILTIASHSDTMDECRPYFEDENDLYWYVAQMELWWIAMSPCVFLEIGWEIFKDWREQRRQSRAYDDYHESMVYAYCTSQFEDVVLHLGFTPPPCDVTATVYINVSAFSDVANIDTECVHV